MSRVMLAIAASLCLAHGAALAKPSHHAHRHVRATRASDAGGRADRVPLGTDTGPPGSANSANPAPNVSPFQTPQDPLKAPRL